MCCGDKIELGEPQAPPTRRWGERERLSRLEPDTTSVIPSDLPWRVWWSDGTDVRVYSSRTTSWNDLPVDGIQAVVAYEPSLWKPEANYRQLYYSADWYVCNKVCKFGTLVDDDLFDSIMRDVMSRESW